MTVQPIHVCLQDSRSSERRYIPLHDFLARLVKRPLALLTILYYQPNAHEYHYRTMMSTTIILSDRLPHPLPAHALSILSYKSNPSHPDLIPFPSHASNKSRVLFQKKGRSPLIHGLSNRRENQVSTLLAYACACESGFIRYFDEPFACLYHHPSRVRAGIARQTDSSEKRRLVRFAIRPERTLITDRGNPFQREGRG